MKICWDNLEKLVYKGNGKWRDKCGNFYYESINSCLYCGDTYFTRDLLDEGKCCSYSCHIPHIHKGTKHSKEHNEKIGNAHRGRVLSEEHKEKIGNIHRGKVLSEEVRNKISNTLKGKYINENNNWWTGGFFKRNVYSYDKAYEILHRIDEIRRNEEDPEVLETKCTYCGKWFIPTYTAAKHRIDSLNDNGDYKRLYCSKECKKACPVYYKKIEGLLKLSSKKSNHKYLSREMQPELRKMVLERDNWTCQKCGKDKCVELHCHHLNPVVIEPVESCDLDNCITYCKDCHVEAHKKDGCKYGQLKGDAICEKTI